MFILARGLGQDTFTAGLNQEKMKEDVLTRGLKPANMQYIIFTNICNIIIFNRKNIVISFANRFTFHNALRLQQIQVYSHDCG